MSLRLLAFALRALGDLPRTWWQRLASPAEARLRGVRLPLPEELPASLRRRILAGRYERGESRAVLLHLAPDDVVLELGGGLGYLAALCALRVGSHRVTTYEANPDLVPALARTLAANGVAARVEHAVVGLTEGTATFYVERSFDASSALRGSAAARSVTVPQVDLRRVIERVRPTFLIMDVEGAELDLVPAIAWGSIRTLLLELHPAFIGESGTRCVLEVLRDAGFVERRWSSSARKRLFQRRMPTSATGS